MDRGRDVALYHLSIKIISRGKGKSAVAAAAYRAGEKITNERDGITHDYTRKGGIIHTEILLPDHAPREYVDRAVLWNAVEKSERYKTAQLSREVELSLPRELSIEQSISLAREFVKNTFVEKGMCADVAIHETKTGNPHVHVMLTMRPIDDDGTWGAKSRTVDGVKIPTVDWNEQTKAEGWRAAWENYANAELERQGFTARINHKSYERQGVEQIPTVHLGAAASQMEKRGIATERGDINREIMVTNQQLRQIKARLSKLETWLKEEMQNTDPPTLADFLFNIFERQGQSGQPSRYYSGNNREKAENMLKFLQDNRIMDMGGLENHLKAMMRKRSAIREELKPIERRIGTLDEHISHSGNYKSYYSYKAQHDKLYAEYQSIKKAGGFGAGRKAQKALDTANDYYESNRMKITLYESAERHLTAHLNGRNQIPLPAWEKEREKLAADLNRLSWDYQNLKAEVAEVEKMRVTVYDILSAEKRREQPQRSRELER